MPHAKRPQKAHAIHAGAGHNDRDAAIAELISGLNYLVAQSQAANLGTAARILCTAKEDMVHWAVDMNFHETARERFINTQLFGPFGSASASIIPKKLVKSDHHSNKKS